MVSWHISCSSYTGSYKSLPTPHQAPQWLVQRLGMGGTGEDSEIAATKRWSPPSCLAAPGTAHGAPGVLLPGAVASAAAFISRRHGYCIYIPGEPLWWGGGRRCL